MATLTHVVVAALLSILETTIIILPLIRYGYFESWRESFQVTLSLELLLWYLFSLGLSSWCREVKEVEIKRESTPMFRCITVVGAASFISFILTMLCHYLHPFERWGDVIVAAVSIQLAMSLVMSLVTYQEEEEPLEETTSV